MSQQLKLFMRSPDHGDRGGEVTLTVGTKLFDTTDPWFQGPYHVRGFVDDQVIIVRHWSTSKRCWLYRTTYAHEFELGCWSLKPLPKPEKQGPPA